MKFPRGQGPAGYDHAVARRGSVPAAGVALGLGLAARPVRAEDVPYVRLVYEVAPQASCPDERYLRDALTSRMGYDPVRGEGKGSVEVRVASGGAGALAATVTFQADPSTKPTRRELAAKDGRCVDLVQAVAVTLAILVDPLGEQRQHRISAGDQA